MNKIDTQKVSILALKLHPSIDQSSHIRQSSRLSSSKRGQVLALPAIKISLDLWFHQMNEGRKEISVFAFSYDEFYLFSDIWQLIEMKISIDWMLPGKFELLAWSKENHSEYVFNMKISKRRAHTRVIRCGPTYAMWFVSIRPPMRIRTWSYFCILASRKVRVSKIPLVINDDFS